MRGYELLIDHVICNLEEKKFPRMSSFLSYSHIVKLAHVLRHLYHNDIGLNYLKLWRNQ